MNKHTPGPWHVQDDHGKRWIETSGNDDTIAEIHRRANKGSVYSCTQALANANLIAAAPDMLEVLETIKRRMYEPRALMLEEVEAFLDKTIAKARGEA